MQYKLHITPDSQSAIFTPSDFAFPHDAVVAETTLNTEMTLIADVDLDLLKELRKGLCFVYGRKDREKYFNFWWICGIKQCNQCFRRINILRDVWHEKLLALLQVVWVVTISFSIVLSSEENREVSSDLRRRFK